MGQTEHPRMRPPSTDVIPGTVHVQPLNHQMLVNRVNVTDLPLDLPTQPTFAMKIFAPTLVPLTLIMPWTQMPEMSLQSFTDLD